MRVVSARTALYLVLFGVAPLVQAQPGGGELRESVDPALLQLQACRSITERSARFDCYDAVEVGATTAPTAPVTPATAEAAATPATTVSSATPAVPAGTAAAPAVAAAPAAGAEPALARFGLSSRLEQNADTGAVELVDRVAELKLVQHNQWQLTLESGQVWRQMLSRQFNLKAGQDVRIRQIGDGPNYRLSSPQLSGFIQVQRVR